MDWDFYEDPAFKYLLNAFKESDENSVVDFLVNEGSSYYLELVQNATGEGYKLNSSEEMDEFQQQVIEGIEELVN